MTAPSQRSRRFFVAFSRYTDLQSPSSYCAGYSRPRARLDQAKPSRTRTLDRHASTTSDFARPAITNQKTHYSLFPKTLPKGSPPTGPFAIDTSALRKEFLQLQASAHPDRHTGANKQKAEGTSALINEAYKTLQNPLQRAQYLLSLRGIDVAEDERAKTEDMELLESVMEVRSLIEGAEEEAELEETRTENEGRIEESVRGLDEAFKRDDIERAKGEAIRLRYWMNIRESLDSWEKGKPVVLVH